jgi:hypothetical protein
MPTVLPGKLLVFPPRCFIMGKEPRTFRDRVELFMDRASSLIFPGSKTLAGWWRQMLPCQPQAFWVGYGYVHRIEAPVNVLRAQPVEVFTHLVLQALSLDHADSAGVAGLQKRLGLPVAVIQRVLVGMESDGFVARIDSSCWRISDLGADALRSRHFHRPAQERRVFPFLERLDSSGQRLGPPRYVPLSECAGTPWQVDEPHRFEVDCLRTAIEQPRESAGASAFPTEVQSLVNSAATEAWQQVIVDRPERVLLLLVQTNTGGAAELLGFAVKIDGWTLCDQAPVLRLPAAAIVPELVPSVSTEDWHVAWRSWCRERQLPVNEVEACTINYRAPRLEVQPPPRLLQRLQAAKSDLFKGDAWLLVGDGYVRQAAQLAVTP